MTQRKKIEASNFMDFMERVQESVKEGFEIDFSSNETCPINMIGYYRCWMQKGKKLAALLKGSESFVEKTSPEPTPEVKQEVTEPEKDFKPSVVFVAEESVKKAPKRRGRPANTDRGV